jgi:hypothetical protein
MKIARLFIAACAAALIDVGTALAQEESPEGEDISQAASDPTASLMSIQLADWYTFNYHHLDDETDNAVVFRPVIPFTTGEINHIFRATLPVITDHPFLESGLTDTTLFDLVVFSASWGRWGIGAVALLPTGGEDSGAGQWGVGPAIGFTAKNGPVLWGLFNQNVFTIAGDHDRPEVNISVLQPILNMKLGDGWTAGLSEMSFTYDWDKGEFISLPAGLSLNKLVRFGDQPVQFGAQYEHNFYNDGPGQSDTVRFSMKFLFPTQ